MENNIGLQSSDGGLQSREREGDVIKKIETVEEDEGEQIKKATDPRKGFDVSKPIVASL